MFIRRTKTRATDRGENYYSYRLVDTHRLGERVHQRTLLNLGNGFALPQEHWKALTQRIKQIVLGQHDLLQASTIAEVEREAQSIAAALLHKYAGSQLLLSPQKETPDAHVSASKANRPQPTDGRDLRSVDLASLQLMNSRSVGAEAVALSALLEVRLDEKLQALGFTTKQTKAAIGNLIGRSKGVRPEWH